MDLNKRSTTLKRTININDYKINIYYSSMTNNIIDEFENEIKKIINIVNNKPININKKYINGYNNFFGVIDNSIDLSITQEYENFTIKELVIKSLMDYYDPDKAIYIFLNNINSETIINDELIKIITKDYYKKIDQNYSKLTLNPFDNKYQKLIKMLYKIPKSCINNTTFKQNIHHIMNNKEFYNNFIKIQKISDINDKKLYENFNSFINENNSLMINNDPP